MSSSFSTPIGVLSWDGNLAEDTLITFPDGAEVPFYSVISQTNGAALEWLSGS